MFNTRLFKALLLSVICAANADVPQQQQREVNHLLQFVENSSCIVDRNGSEHSGKDAVKHIKKKYKHFRDDIESTEDFIRYSATKSTMSGKHYKVKCGNQVATLTKDWLLQELAVYRRNSKG